MMYQTSIAMIMAAALAAAGPVDRRAVAALDQSATAEAHPRDNTATRAFSNVQIKTSDGKCLRVDKLSGDFRANLTPIQIADCGSTDGQGWDIITSGAHNDQKGQILIVNTLTQACANFDPRRAAGNQVNLFSCGGRADGSGQTTSSQLFAFNGTAGPLSLSPQNDATQCFVAKGNVVDIAKCNSGDSAQLFTFGGSSGASPSGSKNKNKSKNKASDIFNVEPTAAPAADNSDCSAVKVATVTEYETVTLPTPAGATGSYTMVTITGKPDVSATSSAVDVVNNPQVTGSPAGGASSGVASSGTPTGAVPVSGAGGTLNPSAAAEANAFDRTANRPVESVNIRASDGRCLSIDPTAGDFRENAIPIQLAKCSESPNQKFDIVTKGKHDDGKGGEALIVNVATNGCLNFDSRKPAGSQVNMFSCGGRADGSGATATSQLFPFKANSNSIVLTPASADQQTCLVAGSKQLESAQCNGQKNQTFEIVEVL